MVMGYERDTHGDYGLGRALEAAWRKKERLPGMRHLLST